MPDNVRPPVKLPRIAKLISNRPCRVPFGQFIRCSLPLLAAAVGVLHAFPAVGRGRFRARRRVARAPHGPGRRRRASRSISVRACVYWPWLLKEIVKSAWDVSKIILHPAAADQPDARALQAEPADRRGPGHPRQLDHPHARHDHGRGRRRTSSWCTASRAAAPRARSAARWTAA